MVVEEEEVLELEVWMKIGLEDGREWRMRREEVVV